jgi:TetR/AcrR family transcriptional repressor of nem operon
MDRIFSAQVAPLVRLKNWCSHVYKSQKEKAAEYGHICGCPYASIGAEVATQDDKIRAKSEELIARNRKYLESAIADAKREGSVSAEDPSLAAQQVYSFVLGAILQAKIQNDVEVLRHLEQTVMAIIGARTAVPA